MTNYSLLKSRPLRWETAKKTNIVTSYWWKTPRAKCVCSHVDTGELAGRHSHHHGIRGHFTRKYCKVCRWTDYCARARVRITGWAMAGVKDGPPPLKFCRIKCAPKLSACCLPKFVDTRRIILLHVFSHFPLDFSSRHREGQQPPAEHRIRLFLPILWWRIVINYYSHSRAFRHRCVGKHRTSRFCTILW